MHKMFLCYPYVLEDLNNYTKDEPNFPQQNNVILKNGIWHRQGCEFQGLFKDLNRIQGLFNMTSKIQDLFKIVQTMRCSST